MKTTYSCLIAASLMAASCQVTKPYRPPAQPDSTLFRGQTGADSVGIAALPWQTFFADTILQSLIGEAIRENADLRIAATRIDAAAATFRKSKAAFYPDLTLTAGVKQSKLPFPQGFGLIDNATQYDAGLSSSWEADVWGKLSAAKRVAQAELLGTEAARRAIQTRLVADIALNYVSLLALDEQLQLLEKTVKNRTEDVETMKLLNESNTVTGAAVVQSEANKYGVVVTIPDVKRQIRETEHTLCVLLNRKPGAVTRGVLAGFTLPADLRTGVPAGLLAYRPEISQAELSLRAAFENSNVARTYFYPSLRITGGTGFSSFDFNEWFSATGLFANIAGGLTQPLFAKGENKARLRIAEAQQKEAMTAFEKALLVAGQEVSNALYLVEAATEKQQARADQLAALEKAVEFTKDLLQYNSLTNYTDVLTSEQSLLAAQTSMIADKLQQWQGMIALYRALGGGWK